MIGVIIMWMYIAVICHGLMAAQNFSGYKIIIVHNNYSTLLYNDNSVIHSHNKI